MDLLNVRPYLDLFKEMSIDLLHIDIMDGHFVPNFTLGIDFCRAVYEYAEIPLDIHLMIDNPQNFIDKFLEFKGSILSIHPEVLFHALPLIKEIVSNGLRAGISISPGVLPESINYLLPYVDQVNVMTVVPGFAGQKLIPEMLSKIKAVSNAARGMGLNIDIEVDGNVSWENIPEMAAVGANVFVAGTSSIFQPQTDIRDNITRFRSILKNLNNKSS